MFSQKKYLKNSFERVFMIFSIWITFTTILSNFVFTKEEDEEQQEDPENEGCVIDITTTWKIFRLMLKTLLTKNWLMFLGMCYMQRLGNSFFESTLNLTILDNQHITKETFVKVDS